MCNRRSGVALLFINPQGGGFCIAARGQAGRVDPVNNCGLTWGLVTDKMQRSMALRRADFRFHVGSFDDDCLAHCTHARRVQLASLRNFPLLRRGHHR